MAARTASVSGLWSDTATWGGAAVPVNGDTFTINAGVIVTMDVDQSGMANGMGASVINGELRFQRSPGIYILKMSGGLSGTGVIDASNGNTDGAYAAGQVAEIRFTGNFVNSVSGVHNVVCLEPAVKHVRLTQAESLGATTLHIDTNITGEPVYWKAGDRLRVCNIAGAASSEEVTITGTPTANTIDISSGLAAAKLSGTFVVLITRNVKVTGAAINQGTGFSAAGTGSIIKAEIRQLNAGITGGTNPGSIGGTISNCTIGYSAARGNPTFTAVIVACTTAISSVTGTVLSGAAMIASCTQGFVTSSNIWCLADIIGCTVALGGLTAGRASDCRLIGNGNGVSSSGMVLSNVVGVGNTIDVATVDFITMVNCTLNFAYANSSIRSPASYLESWNFQQTQGNFKAVSRGGTVITDESVVYPDRPRSYLHSPVEAANFTFMQWSVLVPPGKSLNVACRVRKDVPMAYVPRLHIFASEKEPILAGLPDVEVNMSDSVDSWELLEGVVTNTTDAPKTYLVRTLSKNAGGNVYFDPIIEVGSGGGSGVSRARLVAA